MSNYFLDTSALAKHYHPETGTAEIERILSLPSGRNFISRLSTVEIQSVFALKVRTQVINSHDLQQLQKLIYADLAARRFLVLRILQGHFHEAELLIRKHAPTKSFRSLDSLQLAVALGLRRKGLLDHFVCADAKLCAVAADEGLSVINPETV